ncbi:hypothetical protein THERMOT_176, partial [Bathymodiolus thermophilus thioautotrophic gill symbiont]
NSSWDVGNVTIMTDMFRRALVITQDTVNLLARKW